MKKIFLTLTFGLFFISCETELSPNDSLVADTAYRTVDDLQLGFNGAINNYSNRNIITFNSIFTDECKIGVDNGGQQVQLYNQLLDPSEANSAAIWTSHYAAINRFNRILVASENIIPSQDEVIQYNNIIGYCYALRALCHLDLLNHYTVDPTIASSDAVPYVDIVITTERLPRNTVDEVKQGILNDLNTAEGLINNNNNNFPTLNFINFVKCKINFLTGDYSTALSIADEIDVDLSDASSYSDIFTDSSDAEIIFKRLRTQNQTLIGATWFFTGTGGAFMEMSNKMYNSLNADDVRTSVLFDNATSDPSINKHNIGKYLGSNGIPYFNQEKVMRISEIYLIKAECQARLGQFSDCASTLDFLRSNRFTVPQTPLVINNMNQAANAILNERFIELAYEGHRYVDIKRLRNETNIGIVRNSLDCGGSVPCELGVTDNRFTLPIPVAEITQNPNIRDNQNPGYN